MKSLISFIAVLLLAPLSTADAAILRLESTLASANINLDGMVNSNQGSSAVEVNDPDGGSTFALSDPENGVIKVRALASEVDRLSASAVGNMQFTFRAEGGSIFFPEGAFKVDFHSSMSRDAAEGVETIGGTAQTVSQQQASVIGGTQGSRLGALIDVTDFFGLPFPRIIEPNPVTPNSGASVDWSADQLTSSLSSRSFTLEENRALTFDLAFRVVANISEKGFADSNGADTANFSFVLPANVTLLDVPQDYSWIAGSPVPLPSALILLMSGLGWVSVISYPRRKAAV